ncbi:MAG: hypothetical protein ACLGG8_10375 [Gammaproteobacteria bacterium]
MNTVNIERRDTSGTDRASEAFFHDEGEHVERELRANFAKAADVGDANALCTWAERVTDWDVAKRVPIDQRTTVSLPKRAQTLAEVMNEVTDYGNGPSLTELMQLVLNATKSSDTDLALMAGDLVERMGAAYARAHS